VIQGTAIGLICSATITGILLLFGRSLFHLFTDTPALIDLANRMIRLMAVGYICMSVTQVLGGIMRGAGDTMTPMWISIISIIIIRVPLAYWLAEITKTAEFPHGQPIALYGSLLISWVLGMLMSVAMFWLGKWRKKMLQRA
jgi:Na+-driven multidrug efflux pump